MASPRLALRSSHFLPHGNLMVIPKRGSSRGLGWLQDRVGAGTGVLRTQPWTAGPAVRCSAHVPSWLPQASPGAFFIPMRHQRPVVGALAQNPQHHTLQSSLGKGDFLQDLVWRCGLAAFSLLLLQPGCAEPCAGMKRKSVLREGHSSCHKYHKYYNCPGVLQTPVPKSPTTSLLSDSSCTHIFLPTSPWG